MASFRVREPDSTPRTSAPSNRMRNTFNSCRRMSSVPMYTTHSNPSSAHTVAVATPCCPAPSPPHQPEGEPHPPPPPHCPPPHVPPPLKPQRAPPRPRPPPLPPPPG